MGSWPSHGTNRNVTFETHSEIGGSDNTAPRPDVTMVLPFFNPGAFALRETVRRSAETLSRTGVTFELIAVDDGSTDGSSDALKGVLAGTLRTLVLPRNRGKGYAVRAGMSEGRGRFVGFIDADGDISPEVLADFVGAAADCPDIIYGSKRHGARSNSSMSRRLSSWGYRHLVKALFHLAVADTQTGIKLVRAEVVRAVIPLMVEEGFVFDLELFCLAHRLGFDAWVELPVPIEKRLSRRVSLSSVISITAGTASVFWRHRRAGAAGSTSRSAGGLSGPGRTERP
jgi:glycosyltransferase involved in cell wall biosynthesis